MDLTSDMTPGTRIDRYEVERELGRGGLAAVFMVRHTTLGTRHALKVLMTSHRGIAERLVQEGVVQASLAHPGIVAVTDVLDVDGAPGLLMEFVEGGTLEDLIQRTPPTIEEAERLFRGVLEAVGHAHRQGIIHRDLKPANVLIGADHLGRPMPKVADFGLAKVLRGDSAGPGATRTGMVMGTPSYMSPEQVRDAKHVDGRTDIFALGCILYELVSGRIAFDGPDTLSILNRIVDGQFPSLDAMPTDIPPRIRRAIEGMLEVDLERRLPDAEAVARVLDGDRPAVAAAAPPPLEPEALVTSGRPAWIVPALLAAGGLALAAGAVGLLATSTLEDTSPPPEPAAAPAQASAPKAEIPDPEPPSPPPAARARPTRAAPTPPSPTPSPTPAPTEAPSEPAPEPVPAATSKAPAPSAEPPKASPPPQRTPPPEPATPATPAGTASADADRPPAGRALPTCGRLVRCMRAIAADDGMLGTMMGQSMGDSIEGVHTMMRMDGMGDFDADARCKTMLDAYADSFDSLRSNPDVEVDVPSPCP